MKYLYIVCLLIAFQLKAQKQLEKQIEDASIENIDIDGNGIFKIKINTHNGSTIKIKVNVEGEHHEHVVLITDQVENSLSISAQWHPFFIQDNDKLSAHKVISIELEVTLPNNINMYVSSDIASAEIKGDYKELEVELVNGNCDLQTKAYYTKVNTIEGNIIVLTQDTIVEAITKNGKKDVDITINGNNKMFLNTLNGDIKVVKQ